MSEPKEKKATAIRVAVTTGVEGDSTALDIELWRGYAKDRDGRDNPHVTMTYIEYSVDGVKCTHEQYTAVVETLKLGSPRPWPLG